MHGAGWRRLGAAQCGSPWKTTRTGPQARSTPAHSSADVSRARTHLGGRPTSIPGRVLGPRGAGGCFLRGGENWSCVCGRRCVWCGGRRRRIKATCAAHVAKKTRVCVCLIPRGKEEVPWGRQRGSLGTHAKQRPETRRGKEEVPRGPRGKRQTKYGTTRVEDTRRGDRPGEGGGGADPGAHCFHPAARPQGRGGGSRGPRGTLHNPRRGHTQTRPANTPRHTPDTPRQHTRHTPATHPDTPATRPRHTRHPPHARTHPAAPPTHPDRRRCGTGLRGV